MKEKEKAFIRLVEIMDKLREECPWDKKQTISSLRYLTIEEVYELSDAILDEDFEEIKKELGDLLLHIVFYSACTHDTFSYLECYSGWHGHDPGSNLAHIYFCKLHDPSNRHCKLDN